MKKNKIIFEEKCDVFFLLIVTKFQMLRNNVSHGNKYFPKVAGVLLT